MFQAFELIVREYNTFPLSVHQHTFFELAYIVSGTGTFQVSLHDTPYSAGSLFLILPNTSHVFKIESYSHFVYLRFTEHYLEQYFTSDERDLIRSVQHTGSVLCDPKDRENVRDLVNVIVREYTQVRVYSNELLNYWLRSIIVLIVRNLIVSESLGVFRVEEEKIMQIIQYIQAHIREPRLLQLASLGQRFHLSETYIGRYFKSHTNENLKDYILRCRLASVEDLLLHTSMRINEIAAIMNYTDESHLIREFKKYKNMSPSDFRSGRKN